MPYLRCLVEDGVAHVVLDRPEKLNALTLEGLQELGDTARMLRRDKELRAVLVSGEGESFCAGLDFSSVLKQPVGLATGMLPRPWRGTNVFQEAVWAWRRVPVPVITAVHGHCYGGGLQIALGADFRFSTPTAQWSVLEGKWGLVPDMTGVRALAELVGLDTAKRLTMTAEVVEGTRAHQLGLVTEVATDPLAGAFELAEQLKTRSPDALAAAKRLFTDTWHRGPRYTFARERLEQTLLLVGANTRAARDAAFAARTPGYGPRAR